MKHVVSFSGGRTSAYLAHLMRQKQLKEGWDVDFVFMDTGAEHPKTYEFIKNVVKHWDIPLTCIKSVISQEKGIGATYQEIDIDDIGWNMGVWRDMVKKYGVPYNPGGAFCTDIMKTTPYNKYCNDKYGKGNYTTWLGIRVDEKRRLRAKEGYKYLAEISAMDKHQIIGWFKNQDFDLDLDGDILGNCVFCIKRPINKIAVAAKLEPELSAGFDEMLTHANQEKRDAKEMYRGKLSLKGIAKLYENQEVDDILKTMRYRRECGVSQGESCEVFGCQGDLFDEDAA